MADLTYGLVERATRHLPHQVRHPALATVRILGAQPRPILVYQMSKVGSTSICESLREAGARPLHIHFLGSIWEHAWSAYRDSGTRPPIHLYTERLLRPYLRLTSHRLKVITLVRDPIARHVSSAFQTHLRDGYDVADAHEMVDRLEAELLAGKGISYCVKWFEEELGTVFGVDVTREAFDREAGFSLSTGERVDVLTLKLEKLADLWPAISAFVGRNVQPSRVNRGKANTYTDVRAMLKLPHPYLEAYYDHPWVRHFYTDTEIAGFIDTWSAP